ncbi:MAG: PBP1A family penicillin-binding protein [Candidatus Sericytochromatia bacterium]|nr:PBP1A family penicillin-binding protein [Candidatus Tanganyikabacteria bacterium]
MAQTRTPAKRPPTGSLSRRRKPERKPWGPFTYTFVFLAGTLFFAGVGAALGVSYAFARLPDVSTLQSYVPFETTMLYDARNRVAAKVHGEENRIVVPLGEIPLPVRNAVVAAEDVRFYFHPGVDLRGIMRALLKDIAGGRAEEGASTLTQQLAKNLFLTPSKTIARKLADAWLAIQIERRYSKDQILELYLNQAYWGHNAYGVEAASHVYFNKSVRHLNLAEGAYLAGLLGAPERFSPYRNPKLAKQNQKGVLRKMTEGGFITASQSKAALNFQIAFPKEPPRKRETYRAPYFTNYLLEQLVNRYTTDVVFKGGLRVYSTLDLELQEHAERLLRETIDKYGARYKFRQGAIVAVDPRTGAIRAMVGGYDWRASMFNRAIQAMRQPGSAFKPFVFLAAFSEDISPATVFNDAPQGYLDGAGNWWTPQNYGDEYHGSMPLRRALETSNNVIAVKLISRIGPDKVLTTAHRIGIQSDLQPNLSIALGTSEVTPMELASAYGVFAMDGKRTEPITYFRVEDRAGTVLEERKPRLRQVYAEEPVRILNDVLQGVITRGTGYAAKIGRPAAGKTGTTSDHRDAWFAGYTPDLAAVVWLGNDDNSKMSGGTTGGEVCAPLWARFMRIALEDATPSAFVKPERIPEPIVVEKPKRRAPPATAAGSESLPGDAPAAETTPKPRRRPATSPPKSQPTEEPPPRLKREEENPEPMQGIDDAAP